MSKQGVAGLLSMLTIALALVVAGCGGGDDETTSSDEGNQAAAVTVETNSLPVAQYTKKGNEICVEETGKIAGVVRKALVTNSPVEVKKILPAIESMVTKLEALGAPESEKAEVEQLLTAFQKDIEEAQGRSTVTLSVLAKDFQESADIAAKLKLEACEMA